MEPFLVGVNPRVLSDMVGDGNKRWCREPAHEGAGLGLLDVVYEQV